MAPLAHGWIIETCIDAARRAALISTKRCIVGLGVQRERLVRVELVSSRRAQVNV